MEDKNIMDLEDATIYDIVDHRTEVRLIFINGYQENVRVLDYGAETLLVQDRNGVRKLVYIHAISTIAMG